MWSRYMQRKHLIDVTEIFNLLNGEKKIRMIKIAFYLTLFIIIIYRFVFTINSIYCHPQLLLLLLLVICPMLLMPPVGKKKKIEKKASKVQSVHVCKTLITNAAIKLPVGICNLAFGIVSVLIVFFQLIISHQSFTCNNHTSQ